jgi:seryl-tRNA synthetase
MDQLELEREIDPPLLAELRERLPFACDAVEEIALDERAPRVLRFRPRAPLACEDSEAEARHEARAQLRALVDEVLHDWRDLPAECLDEHRTGRTGFGDPVDALRSRGELSVLGAGQAALCGVPLALLRYFDSVARAWARDLGAEEHQYPSLIPLATLARAGHPQSFPQHLTVATHVGGSLAALRAAAEWPEALRAEHLAPPAHALAPAVCYHCYAQRQGRTLAPQPLVVSAVGRCFRYESGHLRPLERLWDFTMREIVVFGSEAEVEDARRALIGRASRLMRELALDGRIETATDPFFTRESAGRRLVQRLRALKYELRLTLDDGGRSVAVASFNHHQDFFGQRFDVRQQSGAYAHTGCVAFGLERWVLAFLTQHGLDERAWPDPVTAHLRAESHD